MLFPLSSIFRRFQQRYSDMRSLDALGPEARQGLAHDLGIADSTLCALASRGPVAGEELPKMLRAVSLDPAELGITHGAVLRDMAVVCSECDEKSRCNSDLTLRIAAATYDEYCPNAQTIDALRQDEKTGNGGL